MAEKSLLPDLLQYGLDVVFVGAAASLWSAEAGHYYAGPSNRFWLLLHQAGFTPRQLRPEEDAEALQYGIGLTGLMKQSASSANHLLPPPTLQQQRSLQRKLTRARPRWVCYNGRDVYRMALGRECEGWGEQPAQGIRVFVTISSSARADRWGAERLALFQELRCLLS